MCVFNAEVKRGCRFLVRAGNGHRAGFPSGAHHRVLEAERREEVREEDEQQPEAPAGLRHGERGERASYLLRSLVTVVEELEQRDILYP